MQSTLQNITEPRMQRSKGIVVGFWILTALFCLEMSFTAYYELMILPQAAQAFTRLGFPSDSFRVALSWAKVAGVIVLLVPMVPARLKEWAYAGFAFNLASALIAHFSIGDRPLAFVPSTITAVLWAFSYFFWRRLQTSVRLIYWIAERGRPENPAALRKASASRTLPSSMTNRVCRRSAMRVDGSPSISARSAVFPTLIEPVFASWPTRRAGTIVAAASASAGVNPACT